MRHFFIKSLDVLIGLFVVLGVVLVVLAAINIGTQEARAPNGMGVPGGPAMGIGVLILGLLNVVFVAGFLYLGIGIYDNTRRTAEATEKLVKLQSGKPMGEGTATLRAEPRLRVD